MFSPGPECHSHILAHLQIPRSATCLCHSCLQQSQHDPNYLADQAHTNEFPTMHLDVVEVAGIPRESITVARGIDAPSTQLLCLLICHVPSVPLVEHTIGKRAARSNGE